MESSSSSISTHKRSIYGSADSRSDLEHTMALPAAQQSRSAAQQAKTAPIKFNVVRSKNSQKFWNKKFEEMAPCRVCTDFKSWTSGQQQEQQQDQHGAKSEHPKEVPNSEAISKSQPIPTLIPTPTPPTTPPITTSEECPPDSLQLGSATWTFLHTMASYYPDRPQPTHKQAATELMNSLALLYPCSYCAKHLRSELLQHPARVESRTELEQWMCELHNEVNQRLGKSLFDCSKVRQRWRDGPPDGSCG